MEVTALNNCEITLVNGNPGREFSETRQGNVTVRNMPIAATPPFFEVSFFMSFSEENAGIPTSNSFRLAVSLPADDDDKGYGTLGNEAAVQLPDLLHRCADALSIHLTQLGFAMDQNES